jgi:putative transposase
MRKGKRFTEGLRLLSMKILSFCNSSFNEAQVSITQYIVGYYSQHRPHQNNVGLPPNKTEEKYHLVSYTVASFTWLLQS